MRDCERCGAANPDSAAWCGQCLARFDVAPPGRTAGAAPVPPVERPPTPTPAAGGRGVLGDAAGFRTRDGEVEWRCVACDAFNPIDEDVCDACGTPFSARWTPPSATEPPPERWSPALAASIMLPGAGHLMLGRSGTGVARMILFAVWSAGAAALLSAGGPALLTVAPLAGGALALWALTVVDLLRWRRGETELLAPRALLWLVGVVLVLEVVGVLGAATSSG